MNIRKIARLFWGVLAVMWLAVLGGTAMAQPLVTGDLSVYYSFDEFEDVVPDESGADPPLDGDVYGIVGRVDDAIRGDGSALIFSEPDFTPEHFIAIGGCDQIENPEACEELPPDRVPSTGYTIASWVKLQDTGGDQSIHQAMSADGSFVVHAQAQANGELRVHLRGQQQSENIAGIRVAPPTDNGRWPEEEWWHFAVTYDQPSDVWALWYNGQPIVGGPTNLDAGPVPLGDWGRGSLIGIVPDRNRQAFGQFDEYYIFTRALEEGEIECLFDLSDACLDLEFWPGDVNGDGSTDVADLNIIGINWQTIGGATRETGDLTGDGNVDVADLNELALNWQTSRDMPAAVPEPNGCVLILTSLLGLLAIRRKY